VMMENRYKTAIEKINQNARIDQWK
jgi:hypothetical protein